MSRADFTDVTCLCVARNFVNSFMSFNITFFNCVIWAKSTKIRLLILKMNVLNVNTIMLDGLKRGRSEAWFTQTADESGWVGRWGWASMLEKVSS